MKQMIISFWAGGVSNNKRWRWLWMEAAYWRTQPKSVG